MLKQTKFYILISIIFVVIALLALFTFDYLKLERELLADSKNKIQISIMKDNLSNMILQKQKSTLAIALSMANDKALSTEMANGKIQEEYYESLIERFKEYTLYQNIWIQILDIKGNSLYRSWSHVLNDNLLDVREDLKEILRLRKTSFSVSIGRFDLSLKAMVPVYNGKEFVGIIEIISHFNSISKQLSLLDIQSVVIVPKEYSKTLRYPFTKLFLDEYYIANLDAPLKERKYLRNNGVENYFNNSSKVENGYIIVSHELKDVSDNILGYFIMFKRTESLENLDLDFFMFKTIAILVITIMALAIIFSTWMFYKNKKQRKYYKKIIDSSKNIVVVNNKSRLKSVNKAFFTYFTQYSNIDEFLSEHKCICDLFEEEKGYLHSTMNGLTWIEYLTQELNPINKVKIIIKDRVYYFSMNAALISEENEEYSVVFSDITLAEHYKNDLEKLTITDVLTDIGNRRFFNQKLKEETVRAKRYSYPLSIIMLDVDYFKKINDNFGHDVGDEVLKEYSRFISSKLREGDIFCRIGGEEFMIILPHANAQNGFDIAEKFRLEIQEYKKILPITMSFGVTEYIQGEDVEFIYKRVDSALYEAKNNGRNKVVVR